jgi:hypothetical protein
MNGHCPLDALENFPNLPKQRFIDGGNGSPVSALSVTSLPPQIIKCVFRAWLHLFFLPQDSRLMPLHHSLHRRREDSNLEAAPQRLEDREAGTEVRHQPHEAFRANRGINFYLLHIHSSACRNTRPSVLEHSLLETLQGGTRSYFLCLAGLDAK